MCGGSSIQKGNFLVFSKKKVGGGIGLQKTDKGRVRCLDGRGKTRYNGGKGE
jgi:hypothetical protein